MNKKFAQTLRPDLNVRQSGARGRGRTIEVSGGGLTYRVDRREANADSARLINSKLPCLTVRKPV